MQSELKACPFCGGDAECDSRQAFRALSSGRIGNRFAIYCTSCNADMGFCYDDIESCNHEAAEMEIIAVWNTRASDAEIARLTEALRKAEERERDTVMSAYCTGATDVHNSWIEGTNGGEPDFGEAASDYYSALKEQPHADA